MKQTFQLCILLISAKLGVCEWYPPFDTRDYSGRDMCEQSFPYYSHVPTLNPYCCRISTGKYDRIVAFEDFCAAGNTF